MNFWRCDRCGKEIKIFKNCIPGFPKDTNSIKVQHDEELFPVSKHFDLCTDCLGELKNFLDGKAVAEIEKEG